MSGKPFHRCTHTALSPRGDIYVSDGYGNARVHKFSPDGKLLLSVGRARAPMPGSSTSCTRGDRPAGLGVRRRPARTIACRLFDGNGRYETQWVNMHRPCALYCCRGARPQFVIGELGPGMSVNRQHPNLGPRLSFVDGKGKLLGALGGENGPGLEPASSSRRTASALDSRGDIYVGEVSYTEFPRLFPEQKIAWRMRSLQKLEKLS
jgi:hypothetical protein